MYSLIFGNAIAFRNYRARSVVIKPTQRVELAHLLPERVFVPRPSVLAHLGFFISKRNLRNNHPCKDKVDQSVIFGYTLLLLFISGVANARPQLCAIVGAHIAKHIRFDLVAIRLPDTSGDKPGRVVECAVALPAAEVCVPGPVAQPGEYAGYFIVRNLRFQWEFIGSGSLPDPGRFKQLLIGNVFGRDPVLQRHVPQTEDMRRLITFLHSSSVKIYAFNWRKPARANIAGVPQMPNQGCILGTGVVRAACLT
jgi:hypothetical protein